MNRSEFMDYVRENYSVAPEYMRVLDNILCYAEKLEEEEQYPFLCAMLDGTIGLSDREIVQINL